MSPETIIVTRIGGLRFGGDFLPNGSEVDIVGLGERMGTKEALAHVERMVRSGDMHPYGQTLPRPNTRDPQHPFRVPDGRSSPMRHWTLALNGLVPDFARVRKEEQAALKARAAIEVPVITEADALTIAGEEETPEQKPWVETVTLPVALPPPIGEQAAEEREVEAGQVAKIDLDWTIGKIKAALEDASVELLTEVYAEERRGLSRVTLLNWLEHQLDIAG